MDETTLESRWSQNHPRDMRTVSKRRSPRMNCRVPVTIAWDGNVASLQHFESGFTRVVNSYGCLLVSPREVDLQQRLRVTNLSTRREADAEVVWKGTQRPDGWDLGVKLLQPELDDFWGVEF
jgi:hypothetical protein